MQKYELEFKKIEIIRKLNISNFRLFKLQLFSRKKASKSSVDIYPLLKKNK
jgi:uncharacterized protein YfkK (UPF0435 family)